MKILAVLLMALAIVLAILIGVSTQQSSTPSTKQGARYVPSQIALGDINREGLFDVVAYGDTRDGHDTHRTLVWQMIDIGPELVINTGDLVNTGRADGQWDTFLEIIKPLAEEIPYYTVRGNHDRGRYNYEKRFAPPNDSGTDRYYSFDYKTAHFIGLDTNDPIGSMSRQQNWLEKDLAQTSQPHIIAFFHYPPFGIVKGRGNSSRVEKAFHGLFVKHGVNLVLVGHDHLYYRTRRNGVTYVTTGGGGAPLYKVDPELPRLADDVWGEYHHFVHLTFTGALIKGTVIDVGGEIRDSFTITTRQ